MIKQRPKKTVASPMAVPIGPVEAKYDIVVWGVPCLIDLVALGIDPQQVARKKAALREQLVGK
jgi:hypothetical protein